MARTKSKKGDRQDVVKHKTTAPAKKAVQTRDESDSEMSEMEQYDGEVVEQSDTDMEDKDAAEEELERAVFGDSAGFRSGLAGFEAEQDDQEEGDESAHEENQHDYGGLADGDLFFTDVGTDAAVQPAGATGDGEDQDAEQETAAWQDSDDERMLVSLASVPRLRKLRRTEAEDVISGKEYVKRLRTHFEMLNPVPDWAIDAAQKPPRKRRRLSQDNVDALSDEDMDMGDDDNDDISADPLSKLLTGSAGLVRRTETKKRKLRPEVIDIQRTKDIGGVQPSAITSLSFHPTLPLLLSSGPASTLYLHHIVASPPAPEANPLLTSLHIRKTPLATTAFHPTDSRIFMSARRRYFHVWNLDTGKVEKITRVYGHQHEQRTMERFRLSPDGRSMALVGSARKGGGVINILDANTLQWASQVRIESQGGIADFAWWRDSRGMTIAGKNGEVTEWNILEQRATARWQDEGAVGTTTLSLGGDNGQAGSPIGKDRWVAVGSSSGVVNIYDRRAWLVSPSANPSGSPIPSAPKPTRALDNLTTPISNLEFSPDGQLLVMSSRWKKDALRIVHLPTCTVFKNWPTGNTPLGRVTGVAFAPGSDSLAIANEAGKIRCWEIRA